MLKLLFAQFKTCSRRE